MSQRPSGNTRVATPTETIRPGALIFAVLVALALGIYAWTILEAARNPGDWLLILPAVGIGVTALAWAAIVDGRRLLRSGARPDLQMPEGVAKPVILLLLIATYAITLPFAGFDIGTAIFLGLALLVQGERRLWLVLLNAVIGTALIVWVFHGLLRVRLPLQLF